MKLICKMVGGSNSYGLETPTSDIDYRGVFVNTELNHLVGLGKHEHQVKQNDKADESFTEFRHNLILLRQGNTQSVELLYATEWDFLRPEWELVMQRRDKLVDSTKLFSSLKGYMQGELRLANGERTGKLGGKRKAAIDTFGFSPKNFVQLLRLAWAGSIYFQKGYFPVHVGKEDMRMRDMLYAIKTNPTKYTKEHLNELAKAAEENLVKAFETRNFTTVFDEDVADQLCLKVYGKAIAEEYLALLNIKL